MNKITEKAITLWIIGTILLFSGAWIIGNLEMNIGVGYSSYVIMAVFSFILFLLGGVCWIYVSRRELKK